MDMREKIYEMLCDMLDTLCDCENLDRTTDAILALFEEDRKHYTTDGYCWFRDKWEESEARCAKLVEALRRCVESIEHVTYGVRDERAERAALEIGYAALATVKTAYDPDSRITHDDPMDGTRETDAGGNRP